MTAVPADLLGLTGKGHLTVGADADINIFDPASLREVGTYAKPDQFAAGMEAVFVNGELALSKDIFTGVSAGTVLLR